MKSICFDTSGNDSNSGATNSECLNASAREAALRLSPSALPLHSRSLRLEELCVEIARASTALEARAMDSNNIRYGSNKKRQHSWLPKEREKLRRTMSYKEDANNCFRRKEHAAAALKYEECSCVDNEDSELSLVFFSENSAGGRLRAMLHCNSAAFLMGLEK